MQKIVWKRMNGSNAHAKRREREGESRECSVKLWNYRRSAVLHRTAVEENNNHSRSWSVYANCIEYVSICIYNQILETPSVCSFFINLCLYTFMVLMFSKHITAIFETGKTVICAAYAVNTNTTYNSDMHHHHNFLSFNWKCALVYCETVRSFVTGNHTKGNSWNRSNGRIVDVNVDTIFRANGSVAVNKPYSHFPYLIIA